MRYVSKQGTVVFFARAHTQKKVVKNRFYNLVEFD